jgi:hypothetical protein
MIRKPAAAVGIFTLIGSQSFWATAITADLANGGELEHDQEMAALESPRTTKLYDGFPCSRPDFSGDGF